MAAFTPRFFGKTGVMTSRLGLGSSYGLSGKEVERAFDRGVNFFLYGSRRRSGFAEGLRAIAQTPRREDMVVAIQSYTRIGALMEWSVNSALRSIKTDYIDVLGLAWWNGPIPRRIIDSALELREKGKVRSIMVSCHHRPTFETFIKDAAIDAIMLRYNAAHPGAEREVFPHLDHLDPPQRPGVVAFTATRWGTLLKPSFLPRDEKTPHASDCYRFALTNPLVDVVLSGPKDAHELDDALVSLERGPMDEEEMAWMRRIGAHVRDATKKPSKVGFLDFFDRLTTCGPSTPKQLGTG